jgi:prepilin peptidase CpaA
MTDIAHWAVVALFVLLMVVAAGVDVVRRKIPNWAVAGLIMTCAAAWISGVAAVPWSSGLAAGLLALVLAYGLYHFGMVGAGDVKLLAAAALFVGLGRLWQLAALTALAGGLIAIGFLVFNPRRVMRGLTARGRAENVSRGIPYGLAIAIGALTTALTIEGFLPHALV